MTIEECHTTEEHATPVHGYLDARGDQVPHRVWAASRLDQIQRLERSAAEGIREAAERAARAQCSEAILAGDAWAIDGHQRRAWWDELHGRYLAWVLEQPDPADPPTLGALPVGAKRRAFTMWGKAWELATLRGPLEGTFTERECAFLSRYYMSAGPTGRGSKERGTAAEREKDTPRRWYVVFDRTTVAPLSCASEEARRAFAEQYRASLPGMASAEMRVDLAPGERVTWAAWSAEPLTDAQVRSWCENTDAKRFAAWSEWSPVGEVVHLPGPVTAPSLSALAASVLPQVEPARVFRSGVAPFDSLFRAGGVPDGSFVVVQGPPGHLKTMFWLALARAFAEAGHEVAWLACGDEPAARIRARLEQRGTAIPESLHVLDASDAVTLRTILECRPALTFVDSIQACGGASIPAIDGTVKAIRDSGLTVFATSELARDAYQGRRRRAAIAGGKGSGTIEYRATTLVDVRFDRAAGVLRAAVLKNRDGEGDPEGSVTFELVPDLEHQSLSVAGEGSGLSTDARIRADVLACVRERGPIAGAGVVRWVKGDQTRIRQALKDLEKDALIFEDAKKWKVR